MQLWRAEFELDGINSGSWYHCLPLIARGRLYSSYVRSNMLHGSETWPVRKENVVALRWQRGLHDNLGTTAKQVGACASKRNAWSMKWGCLAKR